ncbi:hypothetical protein ACQVP2_31850 [Methylobacterium aquaticum]|uniref:hypothetical protein n=1 Tax=Methylobacterium aquaticum TaxID=270351 RepID=UPI003D16245D
MPGKEPHYAVSFAERYGSFSDSYFNASTALHRLGELIEDVESLKGIFDKVIPDERRWAPWVGAEIVSYYGVGYVTCLEWHARSRLRDLLTFKPEAAKVEDLRVVKEKIVIEMFTVKVNLASIVAAVTSVSSFEEYMNLFSRVLSAFDPKLDAWGALKTARPGTGKPWVEVQEFDELKGLYTSRNDLVHEIGITRVGHPISRDRLDPDEAHRLGELVQRTMLAIEASISAAVPSNFPNLLDNNGFRISEADWIEREIVDLESKIGKTTTALSDGLVEQDQYWNPSKAAAAEYIAKEKLFLERASVFHNRYVEMREPLKIALLKSRHQYLKSIIEMIGEVWEVDETPSSTPS